MNVLKEARTAEREGRGTSRRAGAGLLILNRKERKAISLRSLRSLRLIHPHSPAKSGVVKPEQFS